MEVWYRKEDVEGGREVYIDGKALGKRGCHVLEKMGRWAVKRDSAMSPIGQAWGIRM